MSTWAEELKEIKDYYIVITERRVDVIKWSKEATDIVEISRNTVKESKDRERRKGNSGKRDGDGGGGDRRRL